jgi:hypothetical protein
MNFIRVEYDLNYAGGDYSQVGDFAYVPADCGDVEEEFEKVTGYDRIHMIHYSPDELYDEQHDLIEDDLDDDEEELYDLDEELENDDRLA